MARKKKKLKSIDTLLEKAKKLSDEIGVKRDKLRELIEDIEEVAANCDEAEHELESGIRALENAADAISKNL